MFDINPAIDVAPGSFPSKSAHPIHAIIAGHEEEILVPFKPQVLSDGTIIQLPECATLGTGVFDRIVLGEPDYSAPELRSARSVTVVRFPDGSPRYYAWEPALTSLSAMAAADSPAFDLLDIYRQAAFDAAVEGVFSLGYSTPATERGKSINPKMYVQHFKPENMAQLVLVAREYSTSMNVYFTPSLRHTDVRKGNGVGKFEDIVASLALVIEEDADERKFMTLPPGIAPTAIIRTSYIPAENLHYHFVFDRALEPQEARELAKLARAKCGGDSGNGDIVKPWRMPGTMNHPNWKKIERGRPSKPQPVELIGGTGELVNVDKLRAALEAMPYLHPDTPPLTKPKGLSKRGNSGAPLITKAEREREEARKDPRQQSLPFDGGSSGVRKRDRLLARLSKDLRAVIDTEDLKDRSAHRRA